MNCNTTHYRANSSSVPGDPTDAIGVCVGSSYVMSNPAYQRLFGWSHDELVGKPITTCIAADERERVGDVARRRGRGDDVAEEYETSGLRRDGSRFPMEVHSSTYTEGGQRYTIALLRDITERKRHEQEIAALLIERERLIAELQEQRDRMPLACVITDPNRCLIYWNDAAERIFGWRREEAVGRYTLEMLVPASDRGEVADTIHRAEIGDRVNLVKNNVTRDGRIITCEWYAVPLPSAANEPQSVMWLAQDVTERVRLEEQLRQAQKMEAIGRLAGGVAHDFNNLLSVITGYGEMVARGLEPTDPLRPLADQMLKAAWRAAQLTRQLLAFGRRQVLQARVIDLNTVVGDLGKLLRRVIGEHIELATELSATGRVRADPGQLEQVVMNLALNARDAMPDGGRLTIATADLDITEAAEGSGLQPGRWVGLRVSDTGQGIDPAIRPRLFEPFFTTKEAGKGTGLGLATAYGIVAQSGGTIQVESEAGRGATFVVVLPRAGDGDDAAVAVASPVVGSRILPVGSGTVLLIEDEPQLRELVALTLKQAGYELIEAEDGEQALRVLQRIGEAIDLVVTDVIMPHLGGPELVAKMATLGLDLPVLYMSGYAEWRLDDQVLDGRRARLLEKPFTAEALLGAVRAALEGDPTRPVTPVDEPIDRGDA